MDNSNILMGKYVEDNGKCLSGILNVCSLGFPWNSLPDGAKIVDVGGGIGTMSMIIANEYPKFQYVVQDLPHVISNAASVSI
jgi:hypothetical protein